mgnify:CR=1 FL=1
MLRFMQIIDTEAFCAEVSQAETFAIPDAQYYPDRACASYGLPAGSLRAVYTDDGADDPRGAESEWLSEPEGAPEPGQPESPLALVVLAPMADKSLDPATTSALADIVPDKNGA